MADRHFKSSSSSLLIKIKKEPPEPDPKSCGWLEKGGTSGSEETGSDGELGPLRQRSSPLHNHGVLEGERAMVQCSWCGKPGTATQFSLRTPGGGKAFCSEQCFTSCRRASFKRNKTCDWCRHVRSTVSYVDFQDGRQQLQFCSDKCLNQYKMEIFCKETEAHLEAHPHLREGAGCGGTDPSAASLITPDLWLRDCRSPEESEDSPPSPRLPTKRETLTEEEPVQRREVKKRHPRSSHHQQQQQQQSKRPGTPPLLRVPLHHPVPPPHLPPPPPHHLFSHPPPPPPPSHLSHPWRRKSQMPGLVPLARPLPLFLPPPTTLIPYPIILPIPIPIPIPIPLPGLKFSDLLSQPLSPAQEQAAGGGGSSPVPGAEPPPPASAVPRSTPPPPPQATSGPNTRKRKRLAEQSSPSVIRKPKTVHA